LVDDQAELRKLFERALVKGGHEVVAVASAREAIELAGQGGFDLVISDVRMPDMGGVELLERLHAEDSALPVLLVSGSPDLETAMKAVKYGAFEYLVKPVSFDALRASAARAIEQRRKHEQENHALAQYRSGERLRARAGAGGERESWTGELLDGRFRVGRLLGARPRLPRSSRRGSRRRGVRRPGPL
jgi:DNA-binding NtrC family response regulator